MISIGIDIGGTKVAFGAVSDGGDLLTSKEMPMEPEMVPEEFLADVISAVKRMIEEEKLTGIRGIGIGAPGPVHSEKGLIVAPPNMPKWRDIDAAGIITKAFELPVYLENDANAAAMAEKWVGSAQQYSHFIYLTVSTGIGAGIVSGDKLIKGRSGNAGDVGHMVVDYGYPETCVCGLKGCFEQIASGTAIAKRVTRLKNEPWTAAEAFSAYRKGDTALDELLDEILDQLASGVVSLINIFDPEAMIIGGGVTRAGAPVFDKLRKAVKNHALSPYGRRVEILPSRIVTANGIIGAASLAAHADMLK